MKKNYYGVKVGKKSGVIVRTWVECRELINGIAGAQYKGFKWEVDVLEYMATEVKRHMKFVPKRMTEYRSWTIQYAPPPIPTRVHDWQAIHDNYDGTGGMLIVSGKSVDDCKEQIDERMEEDNWSDFV